MSEQPGHDPLPDDLVAMLEAVAVAEQQLFARFDDSRMSAPMPDDAWSPQDLLGHLAAWRAIEARRLQAAAGGPPVPADDPAPDEPVDEANARLQGARAGRTRAEIEAEAAASIAALVSAIGTSSSDSLCECDQLAAGIGANGINHAVGHLGDIARLVDDQASYAALAGEVERVLARGHLLPRDAGVLLYNVACNQALAGELDEARRLLRRAFRQRPDLADHAPNDPDLIALRGELSELSPA